MACFRIVAYPKRRLSIRVLAYTVKTKRGPANIAKTPFFSVYIFIAVASFEHPLDGGDVIVPVASRRELQVAHLLQPATFLNHPTVPRVNAHLAGPIIQDLIPMPFNLSRPP